jgi:hypothetical protein
MKARRIGVVLSVIWFLGFGVYLWNVSNENARCPYTLDGKRGVGGPTPQHSQRLANFKLFLNSQLRPLSEAGISGPLRRLCEPRTIHIHPSQRTSKGGILDLALVGFRSWRTSLGMR